MQFRIREKFLAMGGCVRHGHFLLGGFTFCSTVLCGHFPVTKSLRVHPGRAPFSCPEAVAHHPLTQDRLLHRLPWLLPSRLRSLVTRQSYLIRPSIWAKFRNLHVMQKASADGRAPGTPESLGHRAWRWTFLLGWQPWSPRLI